MNSVGNFPYAGGNPLLEISNLGRYQGLRQILDQLDLFNFSRRSQSQISVLAPSNSKRNVQASSRDAEV